MQLASDIAPWSALAGGAIIGLAASAYLLLSGRQTGISGIITGIWRAGRDLRPIHIAFVLGLLGGGLIWAVSDPSVYGEIPRATPLVPIAGLIVGFGVSMGGGCTSGHGVCGISRFSRRSIVATATFMGFGIVTAALWHVFTVGLR
jgi:uncharacterized protein